MKLNIELNESQTENYLLENGCIYWDEKREFWNNLKFYTRHTGMIENSPWDENSDPVSHYPKQKLSILQKQIIRYLHKDFFRFGSPVYLKIQSIANKLQKPKRSVQKAIARLVKRKILLRFYVYSDKYKQERSIILPNNPLKVKLDNRINNLHIKRTPLEGKRTPLLEGRGVHLIDKLQESLKINRSIIDYIYSINYYYSQLFTMCFKEKNKTSFYTQRQERCETNEFFVLSNEKDNESMKRIPRYKLNVASNESEKQLLLNKDHLDLNQLVCSVDFNIFNLPDEQRRGLLNYVEMHSYDFDFNQVFSEKKLNTKHPVAQKQVRMLLSDYLQLFFSNEPLSHSSTDYILRYWNNIDNPKFSRHKINHESQTYTRMLILTNYMLKFEYKNDMTKFLEVIDRFERYGSQNHYLANGLKKWKLDILVLMRNSNGIKKYFLVNEDDFEKELFKYRSKEKGASARWKEIFIDGFYRADNQKGEKVYKKWHSKLDSFLDILINRIKANKRQLYQRNLTQRKIIDGYETDSILADYCDWLSFTIDPRPDIFSICNYDNFVQFVYQEMRGVRGMKNFWKPIKA